MTQSEYDNLPWPLRVRLARLALPRPTKTALADELQTTVHTIVNWESGKCVPKQQRHKNRIKELCENGVSVSGSGISVNFLLGGFDANEVILTRPLLSRDKSATTLALLAIATRLSTHIYSTITKTIPIISTETVFNTYPSYVNVHVSLIDLPGHRIVFRLSHLPAGTSYTMDMLFYTNDELVNRYVCSVSDANIAKAVRLLKKFSNKIKR